MQTIPGRNQPARLAIAILAAALCALPLPACGSSPGADASISGQELAQRIEAGDAPLVLDVRTPEEYASGHIPGAVNIPFDQLAGRMDELKAGKSDEIVVHCQSGRRAAMAEKTLAAAGYTDVRDLEGHMKRWKEAGLPLE